MNRTITAGDYYLELQPHIGGSIARFDWRGKPIMRPTGGTAITDSACFPMVPFCNRIAFGRFTHRGKIVQVQPNFPGNCHPHPLHGFGWLTAWEVIEHDEDRIVLRHEYPAGEWPWSYVAKQSFTLTIDGLLHTLMIRNEGGSLMPAGLGMHPYFPNSGDAYFHSLHSLEWLTSADGLPISCTDRSVPIDWWHGMPVSTRDVDTVYSNRHGPLQIHWPSRNVLLRITPSHNLPHTGVFAPANASWFCVEPMSHATDAVNASVDDCQIQIIAPGEHMEVTVRYSVVS
jgi:aldose 1-epimerase